MGMVKRSRGREAGTVILVNNLKLSLNEDPEKLGEFAARELKIGKSHIKKLVLVKKSLDARKKSSIRWIYSAAVELDGEEERILKRASSACSVYRPFEYKIERASPESRPVVVGFGPAGMFAALVLAESGLRPIVLERGECAARRSEKVSRFWQTGELDEHSNVQFGEGGAGLFSDGKLGTGISDPRARWVLRVLHEHGAPESILYEAKPHVGTDVLSRVVESIRKRIEQLGGEVRFNALVTQLSVSGGEISSATASGEKIPCRDLILAPGHSARDTFEMLHSLGIPMCRKPFSMGVRIEHLQTDVGFSQYGPEFASLPAADYKLSCHLPGGGSAYTFCMCPGGYVVAAASEAGGVVTNGMSYSGRSGKNANSALLVSLSPEDFPGSGELAGIYWQREIEHRAFEYAGGNYFAPAQTVGDFLAGRGSSGSRGVEPTYRPGVFWGDLRCVLPEKVSDTMAEALPIFDSRLRGFASPGAVMTGPETRSSSPVRIIRGDTLQSAVSGLYPCGEGAGYAGGITSAAVDGMRCAEAVIAKFI